MCSGLIDAASRIVLVLGVLLFYSDRGTDIPSFLAKDRIRERRAPLFDLLFSKERVLGLVTVILLAASHSNGSSPESGNEMESKG